MGSETMRETPAPRSMRDSGLRFLVVGGLNTLGTALLLAVLATMIDPRLAYAIVFAAGVVFSTVMAGRFVYGVDLGRLGKLAYAACYLVVFLVGLGVVTTLERTGLPPSASALVVLVTAPLTFLGGRLIARFAHNRTTHDQGNIS